MRFVFQPVRVSRVYHGRCPVCQRPVRRSHTFEQTINPFNRRSDGMTKTALEVRADVVAEAAAYKPDFTHAACRS
jgi:hypothetical protein